MRYLLRAVTSDRQTTTRSIMPCRGVQKCEKCKPLSVKGAHAGLPSTRVLLERCMDVIMGLAYPLSKTGQVADKQLASAILQEGLIAELFTSEPSTTLQKDMHVPPIFRKMPLKQECMPSEHRLFIMCSICTAQCQGVERHVEMCTPKACCGLQTRSARTCSASKSCPS